MRKYSFNNFYLNANNKQAFFVSRRVAEKSRKDDNPLYLYGPSQTGKTHILYSIEEYMHEKRPELTVIHVSSEKLVNDIIADLRLNIKEIMQQYVKADVLLVDDIQFFNGKEATTAEFIKLFNRIYENGAQIVLTGNVSPEELRAAGLSVELSSRLEWGRVVEIPFQMITCNEYGESCRRC